jgi:hypothetical protein
MTVIGLVAVGLLTGGFMLYLRAASLTSRLEQWGVWLLSTQNLAEQLHGGASVYTPVQTCNTAHRATVDS